MTNAIAVDDPTIQKQQRELIFMFHCLFSRAKSPYVAISIAKNGCRAAAAEVTGAGRVILMQQNATKSSPFAIAARGGMQIAWLMATPEVGSGYLGPVLYKDGDQVIITDGPTLKARLLDRLIMNAPTLTAVPSIIRRAP